VDNMIKKSSLDILPNIKSYFGTYLEHFEAKITVYKQALGT